MCGELNPFLQHGMCGCDTSIQAAADPWGKELTIHHPVSLIIVIILPKLRCHKLVLLVSLHLGMTVVCSRWIFRQQGCGRSPAPSFALQITSWRGSTSPLLTLAQLQVVVAHTWHSTTHRCSRYLPVTSCHSRRASFSANPVVYPLVCCKYLGCMRTSQRTLNISIYATKSHNVWFELFIQTPSIASKKDKSSVSGEEPYWRCSQNNSDARCSSQVRQIPPKALLEDVVGVSCSTFRVHLTQHFNGHPSDQGHDAVDPRAPEPVVVNRSTVDGAVPDVLHL